MVLVVLDSGIGGLFVINDLLSDSYDSLDQTIIYCADEIFLPYGSKTQQEIKERIIFLLRMLSQRYVIDCCILACYTAGWSVLCSNLNVLFNFKIINPCFVLNEYVYSLVTDFAHRSENPSSIPKQKIHLCMTALSLSSYRKQKNWQEQSVLPFIHHQNVVAVSCKNWAGLIETFCSTFFHLIELLPSQGALYRDDIMTLLMNFYQSSCISEKMHTKTENHDLLVRLKKICTHPKAHHLFALLLGQYKKIIKELEFFLKKHQPTALLWGCTHYIFFSWIGVVSLFQNTDQDILFYNPLKINFYKAKKELKHDKKILIIISTKNSAQFAEKYRVLFHNPHNNDIDILVHDFSTR